MLGERAHRIGTDPMWGWTHEEEELHFWIGGRSGKTLQTLMTAMEVLQVDGFEQVGRAIVRAENVRLGEQLASHSYGWIITDPNDVNRARSLRLSGAGWGVGTLLG